MIGEIRGSTSYPAEERVRGTFRAKKVVGDTATKIRLTGFNIKTKPVINEDRKKFIEEMSKRRYLFDDNRRKCSANVFLKTRDSAYLGSGKSRNLES